MSPSPRAADLPLPPPSGRLLVAGATGPVADALRVLADHAAVLAELTARSAADFRPLPTAFDERRDALARAFDRLDPVPPSLVAELAPLLAPRIERVVDHLRRRLGRERRILPLPRVREMDPACVRQNARRPGRSLVEKAGPRQELLGVVRIPRFDTMENRVLVATCRALLGLADAQLRRVEPAARRTATRARELARLKAACQAVIERPELAGLAPPRAGDRPSNALLGDADYRAVWRAGQLLRREEERFSEEWRALDAVWRELVRMASWSAVDAEEDLEPVPGWLRVPERRDTGGRLETNAPRRWVGERGDDLVLVEVVEGTEGVRIRRVDFERAAPRRETERLVPASIAQASDEDAPASCLLLGAGPTSPRAFARELAGDPSPGRAAGGRATRGLQTGICALDARLRVADERGVYDAGPAAAAQVAVPGEAPLDVFGRPATWLPDVAGPRTLVGDRADLGGALVSRLRGTRGSALVVPDTLEELQAARLRARLGPAWFVWSPVAAVLAEADGAELDPALAERPRFSLVVVLTDASLDVAVLEETVEDGAHGPDRLWIRSAPLPGDARGRESRRLASTDPVGPWLRRPDASGGWLLAGDGAEWVAAPPEAGSVVEDVLTRAAAWRGQAPDRIVAVGLTDSDVLALRARWPGLPVRVLDADALAHGARTFLVRHAEGRPTWKDRLPSLGLLVLEARSRREIPLIEQGRLVAPGESLIVHPPDPFTIDAGLRRVAFRLTREHRDAPYEILLEGTPLPLGRPARVRIELAYTYGLQGMTGTIAPVGDAPFARLPFTLGPAVDLGGTAAPVLAPELPRLPPLGPGVCAALGAALDDLLRCLDAAPKAVLKRAETQAGLLDKDLERPLRALARATRDLRGAPPEEGTPERARIEQQGIPSLDWLLGFRSPRKGRPPLLGREARKLALVARAGLGLRGNGDCVAALLAAPKEVPGAELLGALGALVEGKRDRVWSDLLGWPTPDHATRGAWATAIFTACQACPDLAAADPSAAMRTLARSVEALEAVAGEPADRVGRWKEPIYQLASLVPWLCAARAAGGLQPDADEVRDAIRRLEDVRERLPPEVRRRGGARVLHANDEPLSIAIDYLRGRYVALPALESA